MRYHPGTGYCKTTTLPGLMQLGRALMLFVLLVTGAAAAQSFDVVVLGSEPEAVAAAVAAAKEGASVLLATHDARIGGLLITGEMNSLDVRACPVNFQRGLFLDWWER